MMRTLKEKIALCLVIALSNASCYIHRTTIPPREIPAVVESSKVRVGEDVISLSEGYRMRLNFRAEESLSKVCSNAPWGDYAAACKMRNLRDQPLAAHISNDDILTLEMENERYTGPVEALESVDIRKYSAGITISLILAFTLLVPATIILATMPWEWS